MLQLGENPKLMAKRTSSTPQEIIGSQETKAEPSSMLFVLYYYSNFNFFLTSIINLTIIFQDFEINTENFPSIFPIELKSFLSVTCILVFLFAVCPLLFMIISFSPFFFFFFFCWTSFSHIWFEVWR